jgi:apolipoprotein N-acyltransferase
LHRDLAMIQIADITGVWGLTWLIVFANLMAVIIVRRMIGELGPTFLKRVRWEFSISMAIIVLVFSYGVRRLIRQETGPTVPLRVAAIQPNIPQVEKFDPLFEEKVIDTLDRLTGLAMLAQPAPQLVLWPEASTPRPLYADEKTYQFVKGQGRRSEFALLVGSLDFDPGTSDDYNIAALFTDSGEKTQIYRKMHLVPFGEYLPLRAVFGGFLGEMVPGDFTAGREAKVLELTEPAVKLAPLVCFEDTLGELTNRFVRGGAQLLVNITNDGWFGTSPAAEQHLANAIFRTVETRRPLVRCGNTGVTGSVDSFGRLVRVDQSAGRPTPQNTLPMLRPFEEGFVSGELQLPTDLALTFYVRHGDWLPRLGAVVTGLILVGHGWRGFRRRRAA